MKKYMEELLEENFGQAIKLMAKICKRGETLLARYTYNEEAYNKALIQYNEYARINNQIGYAYLELLDKFPESGKYERVLTNNKYDRVILMEGEKNYLCAPSTEDDNGVWRNPNQDEFTPMNIESIRLFMDVEHEDTIPYIYMGPTF